MDEQEKKQRMSVVSSARNITEEMYVALMLKILVDAVPKGLDPARLATMVCGMMLARSLASMVFMDGKKAGQSAASIMAEGLSESGKMRLDLLHTKITVEIIENLYKILEANGVEKCDFGG